MAKYTVKKPERHFGQLYMQPKLLHMQPTLLHKLLNLGKFSIYVTVWAAYITVHGKKSNYVTSGSGFFCSETDSNSTMTHCLYKITALYTRYDQHIHTYGRTVNNMSFRSASRTPLVIPLHMR